MHPALGTGGARQHPRKARAALAASPSSSSLVSSACCLCHIPDVCDRGHVAHLNKSLGASELSPRWIRSFIALHKPARPVLAAGCVGEQRQVEGAGLGTLLPPLHPWARASGRRAVPSPAVRVQFKSLFAFKTSSASLLPSLPVAVGQRVAGSRRRWGAARVQDLPSAPGEPGLNRGDQIPDSPGTQPPCPAAPANRAGWGGSSGQMGMADKNT